LPRTGFDLKVKPLPDGTFACELYELPPADTRPGFKQRKSTRVSGVSGWHLQVAELAIKHAIVNCGYERTDLKRSRKGSFKLDEENGVRLDLIFKAIRDLQKRTRMENIVLSIDAMSREEALYWHSKVSQDKTTQNGLRALRILLGGD